CWQTRRQVVINHPEIVKYLEEAGALVSHQERFITDSYVLKNNSEATSYTTRTTAQGLPVIIYLRRLGEGLELTAYNYLEWTNGRGIQMTHTKKLGDWNFQSCTQN
ncbi:MAG: hypothetical protein H0V66_11920, partial [Bdellovibrionales bacterium]|nr:hypothetical protein [Bdellovibrionales bacterium]